MPPRTPPDLPDTHSKLLERIERQFERLDEKLSELEAMLPALSTEDEAGSPPSSRGSRRNRKPR